MEISIIGLPKSGKTTVFNALTGSTAETGAYSPQSATPNIGMAKVADERIDALSALFEPKKTTYAEVKYVDIALPPKPQDSQAGLDDQIIAHIANTDCIIHVVRAFEDENVPHTDGSVDAHRDISAIEMELTFSDLGLIEKRLKRIKEGLKGSKPAERDMALKETAILEDIKAKLEESIPVRQQNLSEEIIKATSHYQFMTSKPLLVLVNIGEAQIDSAKEIEEDLRENNDQSGTEIVTLCAKLEMELSEMKDDEAQEMREAMGLAESAVGSVINASYKLLGYISFFTYGTDEVRAWTISEGTNAQRAAGKIHTDLEKGFIRSEVIKCDKLLEHKSVAEARKHAAVQLEGKNYIVRDGDCVTVLFNV
ncbi:MAG: redox-regulated ATPase YchF [Chloroflexi bacterium]|jgi:ribosome-binding ATPase|nr:redox-regulated ATPase YchF [Chloroflexota bacterium]MBT7080830.1 redox-regulated ATPase YchF [Chloroflexota bacterium]MBT7289043.1 redox-regulated ATPase YchF [Chloroflexota bacterium]